MVRGTETLGKRLHRAQQDPLLLASRREIAQLRALVETQMERVSHLLDALEQAVQPLLAVGVLDTKGLAMIHTTLGAVNATMESLARNIDQVRKAVRNQAELEGKLGLLLPIDEVARAMTQFGQLLVREGFIEPGRAHEIAEVIRQKVKVPGSGIN